MLVARVARLIRLLMLLVSILPSFKNWANRLVSAVPLVVPLVEGFAEAELVIPHEVVMNAVSAKAAITDNTFFLVVYFLM